MGPADPKQEFDRFFRVTCPRLVGQAFVYTGSLAQAQDLAHETLARAWQLWDEVRTYDSAEAWTRKVLYNLATSEWRRARVRRDRGEAPLIGRRARCGGRRPGSSPSDTSGRTASGDRSP